jgi:hypothetical protein
MRQSVYAAVLGLAAAGFVGLTPAVSKAQSFSLDLGYYNRGSGFGFHYDKHRDHHHHGHHGHRRYHGHHGHHDYHGGDYYYRRPVIVQPEYYHWTPGRGLHTHGTVIVPHRRHYHVYPY